MVMLPENAAPGVGAGGGWLRYLQQSHVWVCDRDPVGVYGDARRSELEGDKKGAVEKTDRRETGAGEQPGRRWGTQARGRIQGNSVCPAGRPGMPFLLPSVLEVLAAFPALVSVPPPGCRELLFFWMDWHFQGYPEGLPAHSPCLVNSCQNRTDTAYCKIVDGLDFTWESFELSTLTFSSARCMIV